MRLSRELFDEISAHNILAMSWSVKAAWRSPSRVDRSGMKRQTPTPIPPRLLAQQRRWKDRKPIANCCVEFNGCLGDKGLQNGRGARSSAGPGDFLRPECK